MRSRIAALCVLGVLLGMVYLGFQGWMQSRRDARNLKAWAEMELALYRKADSAKTQAYAEETGRLRAALSASDEKLGEAERALARSSARRERATANLRALPPSSPCDERLLLTEECLSACEQEREVAISALEEIRTALDLHKQVGVVCERERASWEQIAGERAVKIRDLQARPPTSRTGRKWFACTVGLGVTLDADGALRPGPSIGCGLILARF